MFTRVQSHRTQLATVDSRILANCQLTLTSAPCHSCLLQTTRLSPSLEMEGLNWSWQYFQYSNIQRVEKITKLKLSMFQRLVEEYSLGSWEDKYVTVPF